MGIGRGKVFLAWVWVRMATPQSVATFVVRRFESGDARLNALVRFGLGGLQERNVLDRTSDSVEFVLQVLTSVGGGGEYKRAGWNS